MNQPKRMPAYLFGTDIPDPRGRIVSHSLPPLRRRRRGWWPIALSILVWALILAFASGVVLLFR